MKIYSRFIALLFALLASKQPISAQNTEYPFTHLDVSKGLSHNRVTNIIRDEKGFLWFGTTNGLNRFDGYKFKIYKHQPGDSTSLNENFIANIFNAPGNKLWIRTQTGNSIYDPLSDSFSADLTHYLKPFGITDSRIQKIIKAPNGNFYFLHAAFGLYVLDQQTKQTKNFRFKKGVFNSLHSAQITDVTTDPIGNIWLIYTDGLLEKLDSKTGKIIDRKQWPVSASKMPVDNYNLFCDKQGDLWIYSSIKPLGVFYFNVAKSITKNLNKESLVNRLNSNMVTSIVQDDAGKIWIGTDHGGVNLIDKTSFEVTYLVNRENNSKTIGQNSIVSMFKDPMGIIWLGTYKKGISYYHPNIIKFPLFGRQALTGNSLGYDDVDAFAEDAKGNLWIGTNGGGLIYFDRKRGSFKSYLNNKASSNSLSNNVVISLCIDHEQKLWIGTYFGGLDCFDGQTFRHYRHNEADLSSISDDRVYEVMEDSDHTIWAGTLGGGISKFDRNNKKFTSFRANQPSSIHSNYVYSIVEDKLKNLWIGTTDGVEMLDKKTGKFVQYQSDPTSANSLINNNVYSLTVDSRGLIWIGTHDGLSVLDPKTKKVKNYRSMDGLPDNNVVAIREDSKHSMWLSTANGLSNVLVKGTNADELRFINYDEKDGLQGREFNEDASFVTSKGELIFGGSNGFNLFNPTTIKVSNTPPVVVLTDFMLFNESVKPGKELNGNVVLSNSITDIKSIKLKYNENFFSIEFASLNFLNPDKVRHEYRMEGFDSNWILADNTVRKATYTNLDPGEYTFKVKAISDDGISQEKILSLNIEILPPWWRTTFAYFIYTLIFLSGLFYARFRGIQKIQAQFALEQEKKEALRVREQERQEAQRMHELDVMKIKFLTNVSHEFRTPLSLIMAPVDKILKSPDQPVNKDQITLIKRNAKRLLNLVNQLLDFRKMEVKELKLDLKPGDIIAFIKDVSFSFIDIAEQNKISFEFDTDTNDFVTRFDHDKIERILFNLLSNAFKFTQPGGRVTVLLSLTAETVAESFKLKINVIDTGIGIPAGKKLKIFERFFQNEVPASMINQGSGIGLSITKEFVKMHSGEISVENVSTGGSCFIVELPLNRVNDQIDDLTTVIVEPEELSDSEELPSLEPKRKLNKKRPTVLLVEDNEDFRFYLKDNLRESFRMIEACNGKEGWQKALALHPDLIVSDISMPEMNGLELCEKIKNDSRTSQIPIILLTALINEEDQMKGLESGANDYLTKPFNFEILHFKIKNLLAMQKSFKSTYSKQIDVHVKADEIQSVDEKFLASTLTFIEKNLQNSNFSVEELSRLMNMSRVSLYKKVLLLTGKTPVEFIRYIRLEKAKHLLETSQLNISEICYKVGFNTPKYFTKAFKAEYNVLPSEFLNELKNVGWGIRELKTFD